MEERISLALLGKGTSLPENEGIRTADSHAAEGAPLPGLAAQGAFRAAKGLKELDQYAFFTPALLYLHAPLRGREPFYDFLAEYGEDVRPLTVVFSRPLFRGLEVGDNAYWNHTLMAIGQEHWQAYTAWMFGVSFWLPSQRWFAKVRPMLITIADPLYIERSVVTVEPIPRVTVGVLALDTSRGSVYLDDSGDPAMRLPEPRWAPATQEVLLLAEALSHGADKPYREVEQALLPPEMHGMSPSKASVLRRSGGKSMPPPPPPKRLEDLDPQERAEFTRFLDETSRHVR